MTHSPQEHRPFSSQSADDLVERMAGLKEALRDPSPAAVVGRSLAIRQVRERIAEAALSNRPVLLTGEEGTGKAWVAELIHGESPQCASPFVAVSCAALPPKLAETELFGYEAGAFAGALRARKGRIEEAQGGTLFLDQAFSLELELRQRLGRLVTHGELLRAGASLPLTPRVRLILSASPPLPALPAWGAPRPALDEAIFTDPSVHHIHLPALRERRADLPALVDFLANRYAMALGKPLRRISTAAMELMNAHTWPGNLRELESAIQRAVVATTSGVLQAHHLPAYLQPPESTAAPESLSGVLGRVEYDLIIDALRSCGGNMAAAARRLGLTERKMGLRVRKHGIEPKRYR